MAAAGTGAACSTRHLANSRTSSSLNPGWVLPQSRSKAQQDQQSQRPARAARRCRRLHVAAASRGEQQDPYAVLQVPRGSSRRAVRAAYIERIKLLHPDVSGDGEDTTALAAAVNAAYELILQGFGSNSRDGTEEEEWDPLAVFDQPEAEPDRVFVNPFVCYGVSPMQWESLQAAAREAEAAGRDPWAHLQRLGVSCSEEAIVYLSPQQLALVCEELDTACAAMNTVRIEAAAYWVTDCLLRARLANNRMPAGAGRWG